jgi:hypothetical protein
MGPGTTPPLTTRILIVLCGCLLLACTPLHRGLPGPDAQPVPKRLVIVVMLGMNAFSQRDTRHPFAMDPYRDLPTIFLDEVRRGERDRSTLYFEAARAARNIQQEHGLASDEIQLVFGRGTPGKRTERQIERILLDLNTGQAEGALIIVVAKSLGALDALEALGRIDQDPGKRAAVGPVHMLVLVDPAGPQSTRAMLCASHSVDGQEQARLRIPSIVGRTWNVVQRESTALLQGQLAGAPGQRGVHNRVLEAHEVDGKYRYCCYADGTDRQLRACHFHMEEIVSSMPIFDTDDGPLTLGPLMERAWRDREGLAAMVTGRRSTRAAAERRGE